MKKIWKDVFINIQKLILWFIILLAFDKIRNNIFNHSDISKSYLAIAIEAFCFTIIQFFLIKQRKRKSRLDNQTKKLRIEK